MNWIPFDQDSEYYDEIPYSIKRYFTTNCADNNLLLFAECKNGCLFIKKLYVNYKSNSMTKGWFLVNKPKIQNNSNSNIDIDIDLE